MNNKSFLIILLFFITMFSCKQEQRQTPPIENSNQKKEEGSGACLTNGSSNYQRLSIPFTNADMEKMKEEIDSDQVASGYELSVTKFNGQHKIKIKNVPDKIKMIRIRWLPFDITFYKHEITDVFSSGEIEMPYAFDFENSPYIAIIFNEDINSDILDDDAQWLFVNLDDHLEF